MIAVIDYKAGNLASVMKSLMAVGAHAIVTDDPAIVRVAERIVLPGVGHFSATQRLDQCGLTSAIRVAVSRSVPFLGICVGMQWLYAGSTESPQTPGAGFLAGECEHFPGGVKSPHVGWNTVAFSRSSRIFAGLEEPVHVYFTHSWRAPVTNATVTVTEYGGPFASAVEMGNLFGVQFHPEKSGTAGLQIMRNFVEMPSC